MTMEIVLTGWICDGAGEVGNSVDKSDCSFGMANPTGENQEFKGSRVQGVKSSRVKGY
jgi:hypothetical protein